MVSRVNKRSLKIIAILTIVIMIVGLLVGKIYSTNDNHYVLDVVKENASSNDNNLQVTEKIVKGEDGQFDSKELDYEVKVKNIAQADNIETQVAIVVDTSYSMQINDTNNVVKETARTLANGILTNVDKSRVSISNNGSIQQSMTNSTATIDNIFVDNSKLISGDGNDSNKGLENAVSSFVNPINSSDNVNKYIIVFTDSTDNVTAKMKEIVTKDSSINIISILVDMTSNSYIINNKPVCGDVYLLLSEVAEEDVIDDVELLSLQKIYDKINRTIKGIEITNEFSDEILTYFDIDYKENESNGTIIPNSKGYTWNIDKLDAGHTATLKFKLKLKTNIDIDAGVIFNELYTNKTQDIKYDGCTETLKGTDSREGTDSTVIKICQGYDIKIKAVNDSNKELYVDGIEFKVIGTNEDDKEICNLTKTTDSKGYITITADEEAALRGEGKITYTVIPVVNKVGYTRTESIVFDVINDKITRKLALEDYDSGLDYDINEKERYIEVTVPINSKKFDFELKVEELNNSNVIISGSEFELIQPKLNNKYEMSILSGITDDTGTIHFSPTVMTKDGTYNYILRQVAAPDGYEVTALTLITIKFENGVIVAKPGIQFNPNAKSELCDDKENHILITVGNENLKEDAFDLQINLEDIADGTKLDGVTYLVTTVNSKGLTRSEYVTTDVNGQINTNVYGKGMLTIRITEQSPKVGYAADTIAKQITVNRVNGNVIIPYATPGLDVDNGNNDDCVIVNLYSQKKEEQNIVKISLVDSNENDVAVGQGVVYHLIDTETGKQYGPAVSNNKGELSFTIDTKEQGRHIFKLIVDENTIPDEYNEDAVEEQMNFGLTFDTEGHINNVDVIDDETVIDQHTSIINNEKSLEYTAFITIGYELDINNSVEFKVQLFEREQGNQGIFTKVIDGASYNIDIEWDVNGVTRTKTITGRKTNSNGQITTRIVRADDVRIYVTQVGAAIGYNVDYTTQEIYLTFNNNGTISIEQSPYDMGKTNTNEPYQGAYENSGSIIYQHLNRPRSTEDTYVNLTINKIDMNEAYVDGVILNIKSNTLFDKDDSPLDLIMKTGEQGSEGTVSIDYAQYLVNNAIYNNIIRAPGIGEEADEMVYDLEISEMQVDKTSQNGYSVKPGTTVKLRIIFRYRDDRVTLTNVETIYGNRLVKEKIFSSSSDTAEGQQTEDTMGVYLSNITLDLYTNYDDAGNLALDFKKESVNEEELAGAKYSLKVTNPDNTVIRKEITIKNGDESSDIEITGLNVNVGSIIELTEIVAPIGYGVNGNTETLEVKEINEDGEVTLEQIDPSYSPNRLKLKQKTSTITSSGVNKTNYEVTFIDYQLDTFEFEITAKDSNTQKGVGGFEFKINTSKGATSSLLTNSNGTGNTKVGGNIEDDTITYTISLNKVADYYKPLNSLINVNVVFNKFGKVDTTATMQAQTDPNYGTLWTITTLDDSGNGKIGIQIFVEHQDPLVVKVETIDKITNTKVSQVSYKITESEELPATGTDIIDVGYTLENGTRTYNLAQTSIKNSYASEEDKTFTVEYTNEVLTNATLYSTKAEDNITITGDKEVTIKLYVEPKVPFEITNLYYFDSNIKLQGANFEVISQRNKDMGTGTTDANGMTSMYSDIFGTTDGEEVIYKVRQTKAAIEYATVEDFYVKVTYNANREITSAILTDEYGVEVTNNRFVTVSFVKTSTYSQYNSNDKGIVTIQVLNYPEFRINIENVDRRDGTTPIVGTTYSVKSTYVESNNSIVDFTETDGVVTNSNGIGIAHLDKTRDNTVVTYTVKEDMPATNYQSLGTDINVIVTFDANGYVSNVQVENDSNLSKIEHASKVEPITDPRDNFIVNLQLKNNPILKFNITKEDSVDHNTKINEIGFTIVSTMDDIVYSNSSATNRVNQTETPEMSALTGSLGADGYTEMFLDRTVDNRDMLYTIKEVQKSPGYEWAEEDIILKISYDSNGKIASTPVAIQAGTQINVVSYDADKFEINVEIYNDEIKEFGIHLTAVDTYNVEKKLNDMKVEAFLVDPGNNSYVSDGKYELVGDRALLTGSDRNNDKKPDLAYGEDYETIGAYTEGEGTRTLRLVIKNDSSNKGYYLDSTDNSNSGNNIGYYRGTQYYSDAKYQRVEYQYLINVTFDDDGKIVEAKLLTGLNGNIGWLTDDRYIETDEEGYLTHTDYKLNITMKFFPMLDLKLNAMDNYTYIDEVNENGLPIALDGTKYTVSTMRHLTGHGPTRDEFVTAGYIGYGQGCYYNDWVYGNTYEDTDELLVPIENNHTRLFYVFEESEPDNYQKYTDRYLMYYIQRLVAVIQVTFDGYGEIVAEESIVRKVDEETIHPYMAEDGSTYLSSNNVQEYNYYWAEKDDQRIIDFYIGYALATKINVTAVDDISGSPISNIRMYPFINTEARAKNNGDLVDVCLTDVSYEYNTDGHRDTNNDGQFSIKYWGAAIVDNVNQYIIGSSRQGNDYNGYLFPADMASKTLNGSGNEKDYYAKLDITYNSDGKISNVKSIGSDLWGDDNVGNITWDSETGNVYINMLYSRKFQMSLYKTDYYDNTINQLKAKFDVISDKGLKTSINSKQTNDVARELTAIGKVYKDTTVKYTLSEIEVPDGYYPLTDTIDFYVTFDKNGNIGKNTVKSDSDYFEVVNTSNNTEKVNKTSPDLTINIKNKPAFNLDLRVIDKFYKDDGISDIYLNVTNSKGDIALGNPQTDNNGYAQVVTGPVYPNETVKYYISQTNTADGYYTNSTIIELEVKFNNIGKVEDYKILSGNEVINDFSPTAYMNKRQVSMEIMNMPKDLKIGLYKFDELTEEPMANVPFTVTREDVNSGEKSEVQIVTNSNGAVVEKIDIFDTSLNGKTIKYTIHEDETPASYRTMEDVVFLVYYNADGSISMYNQIQNNNGVLNTDVVPQIAIGKIKYLNDERVHFLVNTPNDNAYDIIIKNEDANYAGLGVEDSQFDVSINGETYIPGLTDVNGITTIKDLTQSGDITIKIAQKEAGEGYRFDIGNTVEINLVKGTDVYSIDLKPETDGYLDSKNATTTKAIVVVNETYGTITVTFKNETKTELTILKQDVNTKKMLQGAEFEVIAQKVDNLGNAIGDSITLTTEDNKITDKDGRLYFDIGIAPQSEIWTYTFKEITPPEGYNPIADLVMKVTYDQYGRISSQTSNKVSRLIPVIEHQDNDNCRSMFAIINNGDISPAYTVKVVTEDAETGKRINGSSIYLNLTDNNGDLITVEPKTDASAQNGSTSKTGNLGINGNMYSDEQVESKEAPVIIEKGLTYIDNVDYEGIINIEVSQSETADGYIFGQQKTDGNIQISATYVPHLDNDPTVEFKVIDNDGLDVSVDDINKIITIKILNESQVLFDILTTQYQSNSENEPIYIQGVNYNITAEIQTVTSSIPTDVNETTPLSDAKGKTKGNVGKAYAGKTVVYTLHQNIPDGYKTIEDIKIEVQYDSKGYIKFYEILTSENNCYIDEENTTGRTISLVVINKKQIAGYRVDVEKHAMDTDEDESAYGRTLPGAKYKITVDQQYGVEHTTWTDITDAEGLIKGLTFRGYGYITVTIEELEAPDGYELDTLKYFKLYRNPDTGDITKVDGNVNVNDKDLETDEEGNTIIKLMPIDDQASNKFTLIINKYSTATNKYITEDKAEFKAELIKEDEDGNITYKDTIEDIFTNEKGKAIMDNLDIPGEEGEYKLVITELKAPEGYIGLSEPIEIPVTFERNLRGNIEVKSVEVNGLENVSTSKINKQLIGINIGNDVNEKIADDEYSLDITKVDSETGKAIEDMAIFKVWLPDDKNTAVYTETMETLLGPGKLDYCYIEQDKDYQVRLTHMKQPKEEGILTYVFREIVAPEGYERIEEDLELTLEFKRDQTTGKMYIANAISSNEQYLKINTATPCLTDTSLSIDILNNKKDDKPAEFIVHYEANDNGKGTIVPANQIKYENVDLLLDTMRPTRIGYTFVGWAISPISTTADFQPGDTYKSNQDITLYAIWIPNQYEITFDPGEGGTVNPSSKKVTYDEPYGDLPIPSRPGYVFDGWYDPDGNEVNETDIVDITEDTTLTAGWKKIVYTITYLNLQGSDNSANPTTYTIEDNDIQLVDLQDTANLKFKGWYTTADETGIKVTSIETSKLENIILYAHWEDKNDKLYLKSLKYKIGENDIDNYEDGDIYLDKIEPETTVAEFINNCETNGTITVIDHNGNELGKDDLVGTGMTIKVTKDDEEINLTAVVMGDLDGNGQVTVTDLSAVNQVVLEVLTIKDAIFKAADLDDNGEITVTDLSAINQTILEVIKLTYTKPAKQV